MRAAIRHGAEPTMPDTPAVGELPLLMRAEGGQRIQQAPQLPRERYSGGRRLPDCLA